MLTLFIVLRWLLISALAGVTARLIHPRLTNLSAMGTIALGIAGTLLGGVFWFVISAGVKDFYPCGWFPASIVALLILATRRLDIHSEKHPVAPWNWVYHL